jgi:hypothetical protein
VAVDRRFLNAYVDPAPFRLLGRSLYPWCLKYRVRLMAFDSPMVTGSRGITPADLLFACQVCAEESLGERLGWVDELRLMSLSRNPAKFERLLEAFAGYILVQDWPKFWEQTKTKSGGGDKGVPWPLSIVANLIASGVEEKAGMGNAGVPGHLAELRPGYPQGGGRGDHVPGGGSLHGRGGSQGEGRG